MLFFWLLWVANLWAVLRLLILGSVFNMYTSFHGDNLLSQVYLSCLSCNVFLCNCCRLSVLLEHKKPHFILMICSYLPILYCLLNLLGIWRSAFFYEVRTFRIYLTFGSLMVLLFLRFAGHRNPSHQSVCQDITLWRFYMHMSIILMWVKIEFSSLLYTYCIFFSFCVHFILFVY